MRFNNVIYFSRRRLEAFFPDHPSTRWPSVSADVGVPMAKLSVSSAAPRSPTDAELRRLFDVRRQLLREAANFSAPGLKTGKWVFFDLEMGWSATHRDCDLPDLDDVVIFFGTLRNTEGDQESSVDLMLSGSTEHLLVKTASAGRMGSGTEWLHNLVMRIDATDAQGADGHP
jgi:hypothetical protein